MPEVEADADAVRDRARRSARSSRRATARSGSPRPRSARRAARRSAAVPRCCAAPPPANHRRPRCAACAGCRGARPAPAPASAARCAAPPRFRSPRARARRDRCSPATATRSSARRYSSRRSAREYCAAPAPLRRATAADPRSPPGCGSRNASGSRTPRRTRSRAPRSRADDPGTAAERGRGASRPRTGVYPQAELSMLLQGLLVAFAGAVGHLLLDEQDAAERDDLLAKSLDLGREASSSGRRPRWPSRRRSPPIRVSSARRCCAIRKS